MHRCFRGRCSRRRVLPSKPPVWVQLSPVCCSPAPNREWQTGCRLDLPISRMPFLQPINGVVGESVSLFHIPHPIGKASSIPRFNASAMSDDNGIASHGARGKEGTWAIGLSLWQRAVPCSNWGWGTYAAAFVMRAIA